MKCLHQDNDGLLVRPRWPYKTVFLSERAYRALVFAQKSLDPLDIGLAVMRGYENQGAPLRYLHAFARKIGAALFFCLYSKRKREIGEIFAPNGHDKDGNSVDVAVFHKGQQYSFLPQGVFTPLTACSEIKHKNSKMLRAAWAALEQADFVVHPNCTESLQIHCDLRQSL